MRTVIRRDYSESGKKRWTEEPCFNHCCQGNRIANEADEEDLLSRVRYVLTAETRPVGTREFVDTVHSNSRACIKTEKTIHGKVDPEPYPGDESCYRIGTNPHPLVYSSYLGQLANWLASTSITRLSLHSDKPTTSEASANTHNTRARFLQPETKTRDDTSRHNKIHHCTTLQHVDHYTLNTSTAADTVLTNHNKSPTTTFIITDDDKTERWGSSSYCDDTPIPQKTV